MAAETRAASPWRACVREPWKKGAIAASERRPETGLGNNRIEAQVSVGACRSHFWTRHTRRQLHALVQRFQGRRRSFVSGGET